MEVYFATKKLAESLLQSRERVRAHGALLAKRISLRLVELTSADSLVDLRESPGGLHELHGNRQGQLTVTLTKNWRLVFRPTDDPPPTKDDGGLDWAAVTAITILEVVDYHGD